MDPMDPIFKNPRFTNGVSWAEISPTGPNLLPALLTGRLVSWISWTSYNSKDSLLTPARTVGQACDCLFKGQSENPAVENEGTKNNNLYLDVHGT